MLKSNIKAFIFMLTTFVLLIGTVLAWSTIGNVTNIEFVQLTVGSSQLDTFLYIQKNDGEENTVTTPEQISSVLNLGIPSDNYQFRLSINNNTNNVKLVSIKFKNMQNISYNPQVDIRDCYLLVDSKVTFDGVDIPVIPTGSPGPGTGFEGQPLKYNRFKNYLNANDDMILMVDGILNPNQITDFIFNVTFDWDITNSAYTGSILIERLIVDIA